ncbi:NAD(P)-binding protein [Streptomyces sp. TRM43335]|uniref:NAD(P)-binding protein n=1 Tax=Streptomyces taklimakanensis TaxID=2569853 RepID=A0A6G2BJR7_9ACTN|nr:NAD(P)H-dependent oxidoreductase [Streptomyces taklimakanensis]MTE22531.1 NAD(P)-binding protein [Streptomyces taklimakanensis]
MTRRRSVVVAGGGIGGLAAAAGLAARGFDVTVVERAGRIGAGGPGLVLHPDGMRAADALGGRVGARIRKAGHVTASDGVRVLMDSRGTVLAEGPVGAADRRPGAPRVLLLRSALHRILLDEALAAGAVVRPDTSVEGYAGRGESVSVHLSDDTTLGCGALVAADGIRSVVRRRMLDDGPPRYRGYTSVRGRARGPAFGGREHVVSGRGVRLAIVPAGGDALHWTAEITSPPGVWPALGGPGARRALLTALDGWYAPVTELVRGTDPGDIAVTDVHDRDPAPRWVDGRVALLGDAARLVVPTLGQGAGVALEDAVALVDAVVSCADIPAALAAYAHGRMERTAAVVLRSRRQGALDRGADPAVEERRDARTGAAGRRNADRADVVGREPRPRRPGRPRPPAAGHTTEGGKAMGTPHIVLVSGSLRAGSTSDRVADWCARRCVEHGATARVFTGAEIDFPAYRPGLEETHEGVADFLGELRRADGVVLVSPTYHATVSGLLKNALDFANDIGGPLPYLDGRAIGTVAVGTSSQGAASTLATLRTIGHALRGWPTPVGAAVSRVPAQPSEPGTEVSPEAERLMRMVSQVVWLGGVRAAGRPAALGAVA